MSTKGFCARVVARPRPLPSAEHWGTLSTVLPLVLLRQGSRGYVARCLPLGLLLLFCSCHDPNPPEESLSLEVPPESSVDYALSFDGVKSYATMGTARFPLPASAQTISLWLAPNSTGATSDVVVLRREDSGNELLLSSMAAPSMKQIWASVTLVESTDSLDTGSWHHLAYVYDFVTHALYVDGELKATGTETPNNRSPTSGWLGTFDGRRNFYSGLVDELRIWASARTQAELQAEIANGTPTSDPDLVGYYTFNEADGLLAYDRSGNGNHIALGDGITEYAPIRVTSPRP